MDYYENNYVEVRYYAGGLVTTERFDFDEGLSRIIEGDYIFRIVGDLDEWNDMVDEEWAELDDADYYCYHKPSIWDNKWYGYYEGQLTEAKEIVGMLKSAIDYWKKVTDSID